MAYSISKNHSTTIKSTKELTPKQSSKSSKDVSFHNDTSKKEMLKSINKINTLRNESHSETNKIHLKADNVFKLCELKLNLKRIDETNYISILSPKSLKLLKGKSQDNKSSKTVPTTPKWSERNKNDIPKLVEELMNGTDNEEENCKPNKQSPRNSVASSCINKSNSSNIDTLESIIPKRNLRASISSSTTSKRTRKSVDRFGNAVDLNGIVIDGSLTNNKRSRKISDVLTTSKESNNMINIIEKSVTPKRERKSVNRFGDSMNLNKMKTSTAFEAKTSSEPFQWNGRNINHISKLVAELMDNSESEEENYKPKKQSRRISVDSSSSDESCSSTIDSLESLVKKRNLKGSSTSSKSSKTIDSLECETPKRVRKSVDRFGDIVDWNEISLVNTPVKSKYTKKTSASTPKKSNNMANTLASLTPEHTLESSLSLSTPCKSVINTFESITPKRTRKSVNRFGELVDSNKRVEDVVTPKIDKEQRNANEDDDIDFDVNRWKTPVNKNLRLSMTPTSRFGSKVRRSILQNIPENGEIEVISTPKTPKKTPKAHVKNLTASMNRRSDSGAKVPCSPLEKARANLHLHAAPKHLPCREIEFKSIHSFLARKISDELTGSMYISGVPGTGKTATVKRVIDSLNADIIMKHSFKFIEINGLKLANPHQAFSVIWKELTTETVSSSRAQALLNDYFSGKKIRELSTILLVDEVDHICNRKQDVVYNILDWPSRTGSKVVVITIANTMDLPERVLRGCVTSRMGLTRLVFKPYTFQQLQEIIMNRLTGNSSFDPDAVQLVARKVAAISGDARRALDVCRRAIDLIKSEDESQFITINHVNQVLNSIMSGVRITAIRHCSLLEQFFLRALRDETNRTGFDHSTINSIYGQMKNICLLEGAELPNDQQVIMMAYRLRDSGLIFLEKKRWDVFRKVSLNVSPEDISYALDKYNI